MKKVALALLAFVAFASATILFQEKFTSDPFQNGWIPSEWKVKEGAAGKFDWSAGDFYADPEESKGT